MGGASALNIERVIHESIPDIGYFEDIIIPLNSWTLGTGVPLAAVGAGIVGRATDATSLRTIEFDDTADASDIIRWDGCLPAQFKQRSATNNYPAGGEHLEPRILLQVMARLKDIANAGAGGATANADLALKANAIWLNVGDTAVNTMTGVSQVVGATDYIDTAEEGYAWYEFDLTNGTNGMTANQRAALTNGAAFAITLGPHETVGTDLLLEIVATRLRIVRHASINPYGVAPAAARV